MRGNPNPQRMTGTRPDKMPTFIKNLKKNKEPSQRTQVKNNFAKSTVEDRKDNPNYNHEQNGQNQTLIKKKSAIFQNNFTNNQTSNKQQQQYPDFKSMK